ncbi:hypothetical protein F2Q69_00043202 [Brassica cretica]|uniref:Uncharacterized protein n=1 Tax=Brassica cretica TaxID=69181 RepID=A0A8S9NAY0_BRACR|nr:hypothetical protein F2Q69_00043202 [Brassica cretica]
MQKSKASHPAVHEHQRPPIWAEEAVGFHKRPKMIHEPVKIVVPCAIFEVQFPIPPDKGAHLSSYIEGPAEAASIDTDRIPSNDTNKPASIKTITSTSIDTHRVSEQKEYEVCQNLFDGGTTTRPDKSGRKKRRNWKKRKRIKDGPQLSLIPHFSYGVRKSREIPVTEVQSRENISTTRRFPIPSIFEYHNFEENSSLMKKRPEPNPIIGFNMDSLSKKPNIRRNGQRIMKSNLQQQPNQFYTCLDWKLAGSICFKSNIGDQKINLGIQEAHPVIQKSQTSPFHAPVTIGQEDPL